MPVPGYVEFGRRVKCARAACSAAPDFQGVCARCPNGHWGVFLFCASAAREPATNGGPGTRLTRVLERLGFHYSPACGCRSMAAKMDALGPDWCRDHLGEILEVMRQSAADPKVNPLRIPFIEWAARRLILRSCQAA